MLLPKPLIFLRALARFLLALIRRPFVQRPSIVPTTVSDARHHQCDVCPHRVGSQCSICSCFIGVKVLLSTESCPDKPARWGEYFSRRRPGIKRN